MSEVTRSRSSWSSDPRSRTDWTPSPSISAIRSEVSCTQLSVSGDSRAWSSDRHSSYRRAKEQELARMNLDFQRMQREYREDLNLRRNQELSALFERANRVIRQIAEAEKFDLILQEAVYRSPRIDITEKVLKALAEGK